MANPAEQAAYERAAELLASSETEEEQDTESETPESVEAEAPAEEEETSLDLPNLDVEVPEEIKSLWEPDFEEQAEEELANEEPEETNEGEEEYEYDDAARAEKKKRIALEKKLQWFEEQRVQSDRSKWEEEAKKYSPLSEPFLSEINVKSRKAFMRQAKALHDALKPYVKERYEKPFQKQREAIKEELRAEARAKLEAAWGKPTVGPGQVPVKAAEKADAYKKAREKRDLVGMIKARGTELPI